MSVRVDLVKYKLSVFSGFHCWFSVVFEIHVEAYLEFALVQAGRALVNAGIAGTHHHAYLYYSLCKLC